MKLHESSRVYLAARYSRRLELWAYRGALASAGVGVTSRWLNGSHRLDDTGEAERVRFATEDWEDVLAADALVAFTEPPRSAVSRGGRHVEFGAALALGKPCAVVGPRENVFHCLPVVEWFPDWTAFADVHGLADVTLGGVLFRRAV